MTDRERSWVWAFAALLALICTIPYLLGFSRDGSEWIYTGFVFGVEDGNSYIAKMLSGAYGDWLFRTPYTTMEQAGELVFLPYLLLGKLAHPPELHLQLVLLFHLFRIVATPYAVYSIYRFTSLFLSEIRWRRWVTFLATFGGGLGWSLLLFGRSDLMGSLPLEFISPESFGYLAFLGLPHLILARGLLFSALYHYLLAARNGQRTYKGGFALVLLTLVQSLSTLTAIAVIGVHQVVLFFLSKLKGDREWITNWFPVAWRTLVPTAPLILYFVIRFSSDPFLRAWTEQNRILSPHPVHYLLAYGVMFPVAFQAIRKRPWEGAREWLLPLGWLFLLPVLAYFPHNLQRRLVEGGWVVLVLLAAYTLAGLKKMRLKQGAIALLSTVSMVSSIILLVGALQSSGTPAPPLFLPVSQVEAFDWLRENAPRQSIVLANNDLSNALPAWAPVRVMIGHGPESVGIERLRPEVSAFFGDGFNQGERSVWLQQSEVDYVMFSDLEFGQIAWDPYQEPIFQRVYENPVVTVFEVTYDQD